ncbi:MULTISPECIES: hypothetical protein [unclassified Ectothiorhodospira]|uniref:type II toxin-antitoxin system VapC family toxin n=1 Tax=unclassified Ectothiorhodospira TaxID=2684909 RepID=UPI001EE7B609|nr:MULTISPECIES: hypothetical protein [unclassified Ectothiorhodospira]MCG5516957.1 hypothetical protein [Ectothiorhodospira sp. 9100]MCG5519875.1 hypothetical protein [Ectothiorhodospira sp. 9905]
MIAFFDASALIYLLEGKPPFAERVRAEVAELEKTHPGMGVSLAAVIRVRHGLRTPDALQAASCLQLGAGHVLLTGDAMFERVHGLNVRVLT